MVSKRRSLELFEVYAAARHRDSATQREQEFVRPPEGLRAGAPDHDVGQVSVPPMLPDVAAPPGAEADEVAYEGGYLTIRLRYWTAALSVACVALALVCAYRMGGYLAQPQGAETTTLPPKAPALRSPPRLSGLPVTGGRRLVPAQRASARVVANASVGSTTPKGETRHHLVVAIYPLADRQRAERALQAFRAEGFTDLSLDTVAKYRRLVGPFFASVRGADASGFQNRVVRIGKKLNRQYRLGSKTDFRDCYWESVK